MNVYKQRNQLFDLLQIDRSIVDESSRFATWQHLTTHDTFVAVIKLPLVEKMLQIVSRDIENSLYDALTAIRKYYFGICPMPQNQRQCTDDYRFARSRFTCYNGQAIGKVDIEMLD